MLDFNDAAPQRRFYDLEELRRRLCRQAESWLPPLFPMARKDGGDLRCANIRGDRPKRDGSCVIHLRGPHAGEWYDHGEQRGGGPFELIGERLGLHGRDLYDEAAGFVGMVADRDAKPGRANGHQNGHALESRPRPVEGPDAATVAQVADIVKRTLAATGTLVETYLAARGVSVGADLGFIDDHTHYESGYVWPAMIARVRLPDGTPSGGIHQTWLDRDGSRKAPVQKPKKMLGPVKGGAVHLAPMSADGELGIAEGIETALSAAQMFGVPTWACLSSGAIRRFGVEAAYPAGLKKLFIFADRGEDGEKSAKECAEHATAAGIEAIVRYPDGVDDFNADLQRRIEAAKSEAVAPPDAVEVRVGPLSIEEIIATAEGLTKTASSDEINAVFRNAIVSRIDKIGEQRIMTALKRATGLQLDALRGALKDLRRDFGTAVATADAPWMRELILNDYDQPKPITANGYLALTKADEWRGLLAWDDFSQNVLLLRNPPWGGVGEPRAWSDDDDARTAMWLQAKGILLGSREVNEVVAVVAKENRIHPVQDYLAALEWDGKERIDGWLTSYCGAPLNEYTRGVGRAWLIAAVARIFKPGCKHDYALILEGAQGLKKSTAIKTLAVKPAWFTDELPEMGSKDAAMVISSAWIIEIAELDAMSRAEVSRVKGFLGRTDDRFRPPFGRAVIDQPRHCVFAGTVNPDGSGYLKDPTGGRRFWPVACSWINIEMLKRDRDQLWAEAVRAYRDGEPWWLSNEVELLARVEQEARSTPDAWHEEIVEYLNYSTIREQDLSGAWTERKIEREQPLREVTTREIMKALFVDVAQKDRVKEMRVGQTLGTLGYKRIQVRGVGNARQYRYRRV